MVYGDNAPSRVPAHVRFVVEYQTASGVWLRGQRFRNRRDAERAARRRYSAWRIIDRGAA